MLEKLTTAVGVVFDMRGFLRGVELRQLRRLLRPHQGHELADRLVGVPLRERPYFGIPFVLRAFRATLAGIRWSERASHVSVSTSNLLEGLQLSVCSFANERTTLGTSLGPRRRASKDANACVPCSPPAPRFREDHG